MFKCQVSGKQSQRYEKPVKIVTKTRKRIYYDDKERVIGEGFEIVQEKTVLKSVADTLSSKASNEEFMAAAKEVMKTQAPVLKRLAK